ncbi:MAG TPA: hypothetical protein VFM21_00195 [Terriglobia bacterium]|nr:hypothetical protein [Terriglobia bacterium]
MENYFNYFTEIEECFRRIRGTPTLLSPLDWALIESWKESGFPLTAVLTGIERSFEKFKKRPQRFRKVNSLAYCSQEVLKAAEEARTAQTESGAGPKDAAAKPPFHEGEVRDYLERNAGALEKASAAAAQQGLAVLSQDLKTAVGALRKLAEQDLNDADLQEVESQLAAVEELLAASLARAATVEQLADIKREGDHELAAHRRRMSAPQIELLERQFLRKRLFEKHEIPRLSLFYL